MVQLLLNHSESIKLLKWSSELNILFFSHTLLNFGIVIIVSMSIFQRFQIHHVSYFLYGGDKRIRIGQEMPLLYSILMVCLLTQNVRHR
jgi:hypothetical protein